MPLLLQLSECFLHIFIELGEACPNTGLSFGHWVLQDEEEDKQPGMDYV